jgi:hypothetical protein
LRLINRVGSGNISIQVAGAKAAAAVGNVTTGQIVVPGGLRAPGKRLCRRLSSFQNADPRRALNRYKQQMINLP